MKIHVLKCRENAFSYTIFTFWYAIHNITKLYIYNNIINHSLNDKLIDVYQRNIKEVKSYHAQNNITFEKN